jgi:hypothetical protein
LGYSVNERFFLGSIFFDEIIQLFIIKKFIQI